MHNNPKTMRQFKDFGFKLVMLSVSMLLGVYVARADVFVCVILYFRTKRITEVLQTFFVTQHFN